MEVYQLNHKDVQKILDKFNLGKLVSIRKIKTGLINPVYLVNGKYVLRIEEHTYEKNPDKLKRESILFKLLPKFDIQTPPLIGFDDSKEIIDAPYILLSFIPGENLKQAFDKLTKKQQRVISFQLGAIAKKIHKVTFQDLDNETMFGNIQRWTEKLLRDFEAHWQIVKDKDYLSDAVKAVIIATFEQFKKVNLDNAGRLTHGDFSASNVQINKGEIVGIFDFEYSFIADPLWDLQKLPLNFQLGDGFSKDEFLRGYGVTDFTDEEKTRLRMYCFHQGVWEIWATATKFMPFGEKEIKEGIELINNTLSYKLLH